MIQKDLLAALPRIGSAGCSGGLELALHPRFELRAARRRPTAPCGRAASRRTRRIGRGSGRGDPPRIHSVVTREGIRSRLPCKFGYPETVDDIVESAADRTGAPTGIWISLAVTTMRLASSFM